MGSGAGTMGQTVPQGQSGKGGAPTQQPSGGSGKGGGAPPGRQYVNSIGPMTPEQWADPNFGTVPIGGGFGSGMQYGRPSFGSGKGGGYGRPGYNTPMPRPGPWSSGQPWQQHYAPSRYGSPTPGMQMYQPWNSGKGGMGRPSSPFGQAPMAGSTPQFTGMTGQELQAQRNAARLSQEEAQRLQASQRQEQQRAYNNNLQEQNQALQQTGAVGHADRSRTHELTKQGLSRAEAVQMQQKEELERNMGNLAQRQAVQQNTGMDYGQQRAQMLNGANTQNPQMQQLFIDQHEQNRAADEMVNRVRGRQPSARRGRGGSAYI